MIHSSLGAARSGIRTANCTTSCRQSRIPRSGRGSRRRAATTTTPIFTGTRTAVLVIQTEAHRVQGSGFYPLRDAARVARVHHVVVARRTEAVQIFIGVAVVLGAAGIIQVQLAGALGHVVPAVFQGG
jgi:hypothetical protein